MDLNGHEDRPRVSVDSIADMKAIRARYLEFFINRLQQLARAQGLEVENEALLAHATKYVDDVFAMAGPNLRVNGRNYEEYDNFDYDLEPFDEALDTRIWDMANERIRTDQAIAETRRTKPQALEASLRGLMEKQSSADAEAGEAIEQIEADENHEHEVFPEHMEAAIETAREVAAMTVELQQAIPVTKVRSDRLTTVSGEIRGLKP